MLGFDDAFETGGAEGVGAFADDGVFVGVEADGAVFLGVDGELEHLLEGELVGGGEVDGALGFELLHDGVDAFGAYHLPVVAELAHSEEDFEEMAVGLGGAFASRLLSVQLKCSLGLGFKCVVLLFFVWQESDFVFILCEFG